MIDEEIESLNLKVITEDQAPIIFDIPKTLTWDGSIVISRFLRDWLRQFNTNKNCVPYDYIEKYSELAFDYFSEDVEALAAQFDYIATNAFDDRIDLQPYIDTAFAKLAKLYHNLTW